MWLAVVHKTKLSPNIVTILNHVILPHLTLTQFPPTLTPTSILISIFSGMAESSMKTLGAGLLLAGSTKPTIIQSIESDINDLRDELALGQRIVTAAEHDRWKDIHEEISLDVQCSAEEIIVYLKGVIPNELFQLRDPKCKLKPTDRDTQAIKVIILAGFMIRAG